MLCYKKVSYRIQGYKLNISKPALFLWKKRTRYKVRGKFIGKIIPWFPVEWHLRDNIVDGKVYLHVKSGIEKINNNLSGNMET